MSLSVAPHFFATAFMRASGYDCAANRRELEIRTLNSVGGAWYGVTSAPSPLLLRTRSQNPRAAPGITRTLPFTALRMSCSGLAGGAISPSSDLSRLARGRPHGGGI